jgi:hypothetical protein
MTQYCPCGRSLASDTDKRHGLCFRCKIGSLTFDLGPLQDRLYGEDLTIRQSQERTVEDAAKRGIAAEPVGERWV